MIFDDNSNFAFTVGRLKTLFLRKPTKMPLVYNCFRNTLLLHDNSNFAFTVGRIFRQEIIKCLSSSSHHSTVVLSPCNDGTYCPMLRACHTLHTLRACPCQKCLASRSRPDREHTIEAEVKSTSRTRHQWSLGQNSHISASDHLFHHSA